MARRYTGLTWDHPRGYAPLNVIAAEIAPTHGLEISWDVQPLHGFESNSIAALCARYDLLVLDHPHIGEAVRAKCLQPLDALFGHSEVSDLGAETIGPCLDSYRYAGSTWALPLDAAAQVMACRTDLLDGPPPTTWSEIEILAREGGVALSLAGPHGILCLLSIAAALGEPPATHDPKLLFSDAVGIEAYEILAAANRNALPVTAELDPIAILEHMARTDDVRLCPLIFGYVNYTKPATDRHAITFADAPAAARGGSTGSTLGGAGLGISTRCQITPELRDHLRWLVSADAQCDTIPRNSGQPSRRSAWLDGAINRDAGGFYLATAKTLEHAYVRPRYAGYIAWQNKASAFLRTALASGLDGRAVIRELNSTHRQSIGDQQR
jgi:multiple sugar transport system substrate-binding protein